MSSLSLERSLDDTGDPVQLLRQILSQIDACSAMVTSVSTSALRLQSAVSTVARHFLDPGSGQATCHRHLADFGAAAASRTHDVELLLTQDRLTRHAASFQLDPIHVSQGQTQLDAAPMGAPRVSWSDSPAPLPDCFFMDTKWHVVVTDFGPKEYVIRHSLALILLPGAAELGLLETDAPRFYDGAAQSADPFSMVPANGGQRDAIRRAVYDSIGSSLASLRIPLPDIGSDQLPRPFRPHYYHVSGTLGIVGQTLAPRRQSFPLWQTGISYDEAIRLKQEHLIPAIRRLAADQGCEVTRLDFVPGVIRLGLHRHDHEDLLLGYAEIDIVLSYVLTFSEGSPAVLAVTAFLVTPESHYTIELHECWPACDDEGKAVDQEVRNRLKQVEHLSYPFEDFRPVATRARGQVDAFGAILMLQGK